ncbi:hypothetical protein C8R46DRAFT_1233019 [Mycena filopes]|nr:hypothetical protein C8R46DRAFT_1233019 [Mycena filopes]
MFVILETYGPLGVPAIHHPPVQPPSINEYPRRRPLPLHELKLTPLGLFDLRRHLGIFPNNPSLWNTYSRSFNAADIAFIASGASEDNQHHPGAGGFFPELRALRDSLPNDDAGYAARKELNESMRKLLWDITTMWDHTFGSTTMILHANGTTIPGSPARPEYLRTSVYLPPAFLRRFPHAHAELANIAQRFIECAGVPTVRAWTEDTATLGWGLTQPTRVFRPNHIPPNTVIPAPQPGNSTHYIFRGRPAVDAPLTNSNNETASTPSSPSPSRYGSEEPVTDEVLALLTAMERIAALEGEVDQLHTYLERMGDDHVATITQLSTTEAARAEGYEEQLRDLQAYTASLQAASDVSALPSYSASSPATPKRTRVPATLFSSPSKPRPLLKTQAFLRVHGLTQHLSVMEMTTRVVPATRWYMEVARLELEEELSGELLGCLEADTVV